MTLVHLKCYWMILVVFHLRNKIKNIKRYLRKHDKPLAQIFKRISEEVALSNVKKEKKTYPLLINKNKTKLTISFHYDDSYERLVF